MSVSSKTPLIDADQKNGEDYPETEHPSHRLTMYGDSHIGRLKNRNANFMYHSTERGIFI